MAVNADMGEEGSAAGDDIDEEDEDNFVMAAMLKK